MNEEDVLTLVLAAVLSLIVYLLFWPKDNSIQKLYADNLDRYVWKTYDEIYIAVKQNSRVGITESEHDLILEQLEQRGLVECRQLETTEIVRYEYRLV